MGDTEGRNLDRMSTIYLLFSLRQKGFMRKDLKVTISLLSFFPLVDFGRAALSDDTKALFFSLCVTGKQPGLKEIELSSSPSLLIWARFLIPSALKRWRD